MGSGTGTCEDIEKRTEEDEVKSPTSSASVSEAHESSFEYHTKLSRQLKDRHITMICIGGVIGTGLFLGTATSLRNGGPVGLVLGYTFIGAICYCVMISLGEMVSYLPISGGHIKLAERFVDPAFSFTMGWNYWYSWAVLMPGELSAAAVLMRFWITSVDSAVWITMCLIVAVTINMLGAGVYGECEFIFASIKVIAVVGLIILGIVLDLGGGPNHDRLGFRYWKEPGPFVQYNDIPGAKGRFLGWLAVLSQAAFSYVGTEIVALAAGEARDPRRNVPKAIKNVYIRLLIFYIGGTFVMGLIVPSNDPGLVMTDGTAAHSPFVIAIKNSGIGVLPSLINAAILTSAWSAASSDLYSSSRALYSLALVGNAPRIFSRTSKRGLPFVSVMFNSLFAFLAYMAINKGPGRVFGWFQNLTAIAGLMSWFGIAVTYLRFTRGFAVQGYDRKRLPYASALNPFAAWFVAIACPLVCFFSGFSVFLKDKWATDTFITNYLPLVMFPVLYVVARLYLKVVPVKPEEMDFVSGSEEFEKL